MNNLFLDLYIDVTDFLLCIQCRIQLVLVDIVFFLLDVVTCWMPKNIQDIVDAYVEQKIDALIQKLDLRL